MESSSNPNMTTTPKSFLALLAAAAAVVNLSCVSESPQARRSAGPIASSRNEAGAAVQTRQADDLPDALPFPAEKISQTVFPIPDILGAASPDADKPSASHLDEAVTAALDDLRKPGHAKVNTPGGPILKVHQEAGILVFSGTWEQTELVRSTLQALKDVAQERKSKAREKEMEAERKELEHSMPRLPLN